MKFANYKLIISLLFLVFCMQFIFKSGFVYAKVNVVMSGTFWSWRLTIQTVYFSKIVQHFLILPFFSVSFFIASFVSINQSYMDSAVT